jgi:hypothetical protein
MAFSLRLLASLILLAASSAFSDVVTVESAPVERETLTYDPADPPKPIKDRRAVRMIAFTQCDSTFRAQIDFEEISREPWVLKAKAVRVRARMKITIYLPPNPKREVVVHEDAHAKLGEYWFAAAAEDVERFAQDEIIGRDFTGDSYDAAARQARDKIHRDYMARYGKQMDQFHLDFDKLTRSGANKKITADAAAERVIEQHRRKTARK